MVKEAILDKVHEERKYTKLQISNLLDSVDFRIKAPPDEFKKGDVIKMKVGNKPRPCVVIKVTKNTLYMIPLSSDKNDYSMSPGSSRFFGESWFTNQMISTSIEGGRERFYGVYDNMRALNQAIVKLREIVYTI